MITPTGSVSTFATVPGAPEGLAFDSSANLYVSNGTHTISEITHGGSVSTFATVSGAPQGLAFDSAGDLYVSNGTSTISEITPAANVSTFAAVPGAPSYLAISQASEPSCLAILTLSGLALCGRRRQRQINQPEIEKRSFGR